MRTLGEGAFGAVHLVEVREEDDFVQTLAVKWLHPRWSQSPEYAKRLRDEARLLALLRHQAIVRVHGLTRIDGRLAILMEPVDGADLGRVRSMPPRAALQVTAAVADALDAAWSETPDGSDAPLQVVHRDIKPSNVMVTPRGAVKVMDFGVARARFDHREAETQSQQFGTARYMAPERWLDGTADAPSDVFSLGVTLLELVAGQPMTQPRLSREGFAQDVQSHLTHLQPLPDVQDLVRAMLAFDPTERPRAEEVSRRCTELAGGAEGPDLRSWAREIVPEITNEGVETSLTGTVVREESSATPVTLDLASLDATADRVARTVEVPAPAPERRPEPSRTPLLTLGIIGLGLVGVAAVNLLLPDQPPPDPLPEPTLSAPAPRPSPPPTPAPRAEPEPQPEPEPRPEPLGQPVPRPRPAPIAAPARPAPEPEPVPEPEPEPAALGTVVFTVASGWTVEVGEKQVSGRQGLKLPLGGTTSIVAVNGSQRETCEVFVGSPLTEVAIDATGRCSQAQ